MGKGSVVLIIAGFVFGVIVIGWQVIPILFETPLEVTWTDEATYFYGNYTGPIFIEANPSAAETSILWTYDFAEEIADETDGIVHVIDVRVGMARVWWELAHNKDTSNRIFPGRWTWDRWTAKQLNLTFTPMPAYDQLKLYEEAAEIPLQVDWSFEAVKYYWNPGERYYEISDQPDLMEILRLEADGNLEEFRLMFANATAKAVGTASTSDKVVDLQDLRDATAEAILQQYPDRYSGLTAAQERLAELESEVGLS